MHKRIQRPSPALVVAVIALFVAMGGTGYAAATGSIDSREVKNNSLTGKDVKNSGLGGADVKANSLTGSDVSEPTLGKVPSASNADKAGSASSAGTAGSANSATTATTATTAGNANNLGGKPASQYLNGVHEVTESSANDSNSPKFASPSCAEGEKVIGGGAFVSGGTNAENIVLPAAAVHVSRLYLSWQLGRIRRRDGCRCRQLVRDGVRRVRAGLVTT